MKFRLPSIERLLRLKKKIGLSETYEPSFQNLNTWQSISPDDWELLNSGGKEVTLGDVLPSDDGTLEWKGHKVILHIFSVRNGWNNSGENNLPKFHVADCRTLQAMRERGAFERYVVSLRTTGTFEIGLNSERVEKRLLVCQNCLIQLNYQEFANSNNFTKKTIITQFNIVNFFKLYDKGFYKVPYFTDKTAPHDNYTPDFKEISAEVRWAKNWTCEQCQCFLKLDKKYLHVHHKNTIRSDNSVSNLQALCIDCHSKQENHAHIRNLPDYSTFMKKYRA